jgi:hypothetical protein
VRVLDSKNLGVSGRIIAIIKTVILHDYWFRQFSSFQKLMGGKT